MSATWPVLRASCVTQSRVTLDPVAGGGTWGPVGCSQFAAVCSLIPRLGPGPCCTHIPVEPMHLLLAVLPFFRTGVCF